MYVDVDDEKDVAEKTDQRTANNEKNAKISEAWQRKALWHEKSA